MPVFVIDCYSYVCVEATEDHRRIDTSPLYFSSFSTNNISIAQSVAQLSHVAAPGSYLVAAFG
jgi:hypothetical protein